MMYITLAIALLAAAASAVQIDTYTLDNELSDRERFEIFKVDYQRTYATPLEESIRFAVFQQTLAKIKRLNANEPMKVHGITEWADLTSEEFRDRYMMKDFTHGQCVGAQCNQDKTKAAHYQATEPLPSLPSSYNWATSTNYVSAVKNQGTVCAAGWAFSAAEVVESSWALANNKAAPVASVQQLIDCDVVDDGCTAGYSNTALNYTVINGGLELAVNYPYTATVDECNASEPLQVVQISNAYLNNPLNNEATLQSSVYNNGPNTACVDADTWQTYKSGIMTSCSCGYIAHCVQVTGWGKSGTTTYWIVRNSFGTGFGVNGYIYLKYGSNLCCISDLTAWAQGVYNEEEKEEKEEKGEKKKKK